MAATAKSSQRVLGDRPRISSNASWKRTGVTIAGDRGHGNALNQFYCPYALYVDDDDQAIFIADLGNHRIMQWKYGATRGQVVAGGNGRGNRMDQLNEPSGVIVNKATDSLIICDSGNRRVVQWSRRQGSTSGETIIDNIACESVTMDDAGFLYVSDSEKHEVRRYRIGEAQGTVVAGGHGQGDRLNQLNHPTHLYVDQNHSVYVSDNQNHRLMKWIKDATEGIVVAGSRGEGNDLTQLSHPQGVFTDSLGTVYVADYGNHRLMRWSAEGKQGDTIASGNDRGEGANQLNCPMGLSFDSHGNLYVTDCDNDRVQRFSMEASS